ncbi:hypothetical protein [Rubrivivax sp. A210]|uniref:hypothetical protein n=1 Tax=Rubrivivax sp. A210 TaxID=2772301 RepID=UPI0019181FCB|nr:hypothetical protein [Rubrivivax sp. A210]
MKSALESASHFHPDVGLGLELVAYERKDGSFDLFAFEPAGSVPEIESARIDSSHIFVANAPNRTEAQAASDCLCERLGEGYQLIQLLEEHGSRALLGRVFDTLRKNGVQHLTVGQIDSTANWGLYGRRKDLTAARQAFEQFSKPSTEIKNQSKI